jgi:ABC-type transport system involved in cytochrome c biogenesis permease subunit
VIPLWVAVAAIALLPVVALAAYAYGWWWRGRVRTVHSRRGTHRYVRLTPEQQAKLNDGFTRMDAVFKDMDELFKDVG